MRDSSKSKSSRTLLGFVGTSLGSEFAKETLSDIQHVTEYVNHYRIERGDISYNRN
jgi:hypothetical protein